MLRKITSQDAATVLIHCERGWCVLIGRRAAKLIGCDIASVLHRWVCVCAGLCWAAGWRLLQLYTQLPVKHLSWLLLSSDLPCVTVSPRHLHIHAWNQLCVCPSGKRRISICGYFNPTATFPQPASRKGLLVSIGRIKELSKGISDYPLYFVLSH